MIVEFSITEPTLKSKACLKCLYFTKIITDLCRYLEYFSHLLPLHPIIELTSGNRSKAYFFVVLLVK